MTDSLQLALTQFIEVNDELTAILRIPADPGRSIGFKSFVKEVKDNQLLIDVPTTLDLESLLVPGTLIDIEFLLGISDLPVFRGEVAWYQKGSIRGCWIKLPEAFRSHFLKRRRFVRIPVRFGLKIYKYLDETEYVIIEGESVNLSAGGLRFLSSHRFQKGDEVLLEFRPDPRYPLFRINGRVVLSQTSTFQSPAERKNSLITSIRFNQLQRSQEDQLVGLCFRKELEQLKHLQDD
jgi:c-di-GMP-binding flagellar brake protein YcgR